ncbi:MAG: pentapeptide repeat-containing protein [Gaiellaceae bacterium]
METPEQGEVDEGTAEKNATPIDWPQCIEEDCIGVQAPEKDRCLGHLEFRERYELLQRGLTEIDLRGVQADSVLVGRVIAALPVTGDNIRLAEDCRFDHATFINSVHFRRVQFAGSCTFRNLTTRDLLSFGYCRFEPRFAVMFSDCSLAKGISISDTGFAGRMFLANSRAEALSVSIKNSQFDNDLTILGLSGEYLFVDNCSGSGLSVQGCEHRLASLTNLEFETIAVGALSLEESFLLTQAVAAKAGLGEITAKEHVLVDHCELGGTENIGLLKAGDSVRVRRTTLTTRRSIACESRVLDLSDTRFIDGVTIAASAGSIVLDETHYGRSALIVCSAPDGQPLLLSARRADLQNLSLDNVDLTDCAFTNAHNLDALRLQRATFAPSPSGLAASPVKAITKRRVLLEERLWRSRAGSQGWPTVEGADDAPDAAEIAALYRSLRSGLETARNEPGAADFYYGEMEMRRHDRNAPRAERAILRTYWALSGYGLRASRSLAALVLLIFLAALGFWAVGFQGGHPSSFWPALTYATGAATLHPPARHLTTSGEALSIAFRVIGPALLGLAAFSVRGRVRR